MDRLSDLAKLEGIVSLIGRPDYSYGGADIVWGKLFKTTGLNPENTEIVIKRAIEINIIVLSEGYKIVGASAQFTRKGNWGTKPKLTVRNGDGKANIDLPKPSAAREAKMLVALLYALCSMNSVISSSYVFYNDKKGSLETSIASKHGPQKSAYMKGLIRDLNDENLVARLTEDAEAPHPEEVTALQREVIECLEKQYLPGKEAERIVEKYGISPVELEREISAISRIKGLRQRHMPAGISWKNMSFLEHSQKLEMEIQRSIDAAEDEINRLENELLSAQNQHADHIEKLRARGLIARIFNRVVN